MNSKIIIVLIIALMVLLFGCTQVATENDLNNDVDNQQINNTTNETINNTTKDTIIDYYDPDSDGDNIGDMVDYSSTDVQDDSDMTDSEVTTFYLTGDKFKFFMGEEENPTLRVRQGETVRIELRSIDMPHDFVVDELNVATEIFPAGQGGYVEFVADKVGTFEYYCSVGSHRAMGMKGTIIVE